MDQELASRIVRDRAEGTWVWLKIAYGDNDFGGYVEAAVRRVWGDVVENNGHMLGKTRGGARDLREVFVRLHDAGGLRSILERAVDAEYHYGDVEFATRGLYTETVNWGARRVEKGFRPLTDEYLALDLTFHIERSDEWANGEEVWLNTETGEVCNC